MDKDPEAAYERRQRREAAQAALIADLLPRFYTASPEAVAAVAEAVAAPPIAAPRAEIPPAEVPAPPAWTLPRPLPHGHDPPRHVA